MYALNKDGKGWILFTVLLPVWLLPGDSGVVSAPEPVGNPWCSGDNSQQEHAGISVSGIPSFDLSFVMASFGQCEHGFSTSLLLFCRLHPTMEKTWEKMLLLFSRREMEGLECLP